MISIGIMFTELPNRDAWNVIRGFVYQVDMTIVRWLNLEDNEFLELERGEDIDRVVHDVTQKEISRELEQVKHREGKISLNCEETDDLLFNYYLHFSNNPEENIKFRFVTNGTLLF